MEASHDQYEYIGAVIKPGLLRLFQAAGIEGVKTENDAYVKAKILFGVKSLARENATAEDVSEFIERCHALSAECGMPIFDRSTPAFLLAHLDKETGATIV